MLIIRLQRLGRRNEPTFRIVLTDSKNGPKSGKFLEILGSYDARDKNITKVDGERVKELIAKGAQLSDTVRNFLIDQKIIEGKKVNVLPKKTPIVNEKEESASEEKTEEPSEANQESDQTSEKDKDVEEKSEGAEDETSSEKAEKENGPEVTDTEEESEDSKKISEGSDVQEVVE